jgi:hypothetical protein
MKFLFIKSLSANAIHRELTGALSATARSISQVKQWRSHLAAGDLSYQNQIRPGRPRHVWGRPSPISLKSFLSRVRELVRKISVSRAMQSKLSSGTSLGYGDSLEARWHIDSPRLKRRVGQLWQMTGWVSSIAKRAVLFFGLWQVTSFDFSINVYVTICLQRAETKWLQKKKPRSERRKLGSRHFQRYESFQIECTGI